MNIIGPVFSIVVIMMLLYFGLGTTQVLMDDASANVGNDTELSGSLDTAVQLTEPAFNILTVSVWLLILIAVIGMLYMIMKLV